MPITVREDLDWTEVVADRDPRPGPARRDASMPACCATTRPARSWPTCWATSAPVAERELTGDPLLELPEFRIGKNGIEKVYDQALRGRAGLSRFEVNALGREIKELYRHDGEPGHDLTLTIDLDLQRYVHERLSGEESASAVVLDVHTGDVLALASVPTFDPGGFTNGLQPRDLARAHRPTQARRWSTRRSAASTRRARPSR